MRFPPAPPVARAVAATPADRDRVLDLMRAGALALVVLGHGSMGIVGWTDEGPVVSNALAIYGWAPWATWLVQIMPLFFVAGGAVNARSWRSAAGRTPAPPGRYAGWLWRRVARLMRPVWVYLLVMAPVSALVSALAPSAWATPLLGLATQLLWFIGVYVVVCALTPLAVAAHARNPLIGPAVLLGAAGLVDLARLGLGLPMALGLLNFVLVWAFVAQLGLLLDDGLLAGRRGALVAGGAVATNLLLVGIGPYPRSMVGLPGEPFSNMAPPSLALALHALALAGLAGWARPALSRLAHRARVWTAATGVNLTAMTLYLWHLPVLIALMAGLHLLGIDRPVQWTPDGQPSPGPGYWLWSLAFMALFLVSVAAVVRVLWPVEFAQLPGWDRPWRAGPTSERRSRPTAGPSPEPALDTSAAGSPTRGPGSAGPRSAGRGSAGLAGAGAAVLGIGTLALSGTGLAGFPTRVVQVAGVPLNAAVAIALMAVGGLMVRHAGASFRHRSPTSSNATLQ